MKATIEPVKLKQERKSLRDTSITSRILWLFLILSLISSFFVIVNAGERGVLLEFGRIKQPVLNEGIHVIIPIVNTVKKLSVRIQNQEISAEASSKDLQEIFTDVALNWHIIPQETGLIYQEIGTETQIINIIINPAVEEILKAVMAKYTAEEIISKRGEVKAEVDNLLAERLKNYHIGVDDISLVHVHFTQAFKDAVEKKQIAAQEAKRAEFVAIKAIKEAEAKVNFAKGEAEAQKLLQPSLTPEILQKQAIDKWNGNLPFVMGDPRIKILDLNQH